MHISLIDVAMRVITGLFYQSLSIWPTTQTVPTLNCLSTQALLQQAATDKDMIKVLSQLSALLVFSETDMMNEDRKWRPDPRKRNKLTRVLSLVAFFSPLQSLRNNVWFGRDMFLHMRVLEGHRQERHPHLLPRIEVSPPHRISQDQGHWV